MGRKRKNKPKERKPVRVLKEIDKHGRVISIRIVMSMRDVIADVCPEYLLDRPEKKEGDVIQFPQKKQ